MRGVVAVLALSLVVLAQGFDVSVVATDFSWAENLRCDPLTDSLFVSESQRGELWRITYDDTNATYTKHLHLGPAQGFKKFLGQALNGSTLFAVGVLSAGDQCTVLRTSTAASAAGTFTHMVNIPKLGNGMAFDPQTGFLYVTTEGDFLPLNGDVYRINVATNAVDTILSKGFSDDGAFFDPLRRFLYVSEVLGSKILTIDVDQGNKVVMENKVDIGALDDFTLAEHGTTLYGADYLKGNVVLVDPANGSGSTSVIASGFKNPTSVRWGCTSGPGFNSSSLFVTEGGGFSNSVTNRRVMQIHGVRPPQ